MGMRYVIMSLVACLMTWTVVLFVFLNTDDEILLGSSHDEIAESNMVGKEYVVFIESESVVTAPVQDQSAKEKTIDRYSKKQRFKDGIPIDELLNWLEIEQEAFLLHKERFFFENDFLTLNRMQGLHSLVISFYSVLSIDEFL